MCVESEFEILIDDESMEYKGFKIGDRVRIRMTKHFNDYDYIWIYLDDKLIIRQVVNVNDSEIMLLDDKHNTDIIKFKKNINILGKVIL